MDDESNAGDAGAGGDGPGVHGAQPASGESCGALGLADRSRGDIRHDDLERHTRGRGPHFPWRDLGGRARKDLSSPRLAPEVRCGPILMPRGMPGGREPTQRTPSWTSTRSTSTEMEVSAWWTLADPSSEGTRCPAARSWSASHLQAKAFLPARAVGSRDREGGQLRERRALRARSRT